MFTLCHLFFFAFELDFHSTNTKSVHWTPMTPIPPWASRLAASGWSSSVLGCVNAYYNATQLEIPPTCSVCMRQQPNVKIHQISLSAGNQLPDHFLILNVEPPFSEDEFWFADSRLNGLMLDSNVIQTEMATGARKFVCHACHTHLPQFSIPRFALANKLYTVDVFLKSFGTLRGLRNVYVQFIRT